MQVNRGEKHLLSVDLEDVLAEGDTLTGSPTVEIVAKRGRGATSMEVVSPAPSISGTEVRFWVDVPADQQRANYLVRVTCPTTNGERIIEEAPLLVQ